MPQLSANHAVFDGCSHARTKRAMPAITRHARSPQGQGATGSSGSVNSTLGSRCPLPRGQETCFSRGARSPPTGRTACIHRVRPIASRAKHRCDGVGANRQAHHSPVIYLPYIAPPCQGRGVGELMCAMGGNFSNDRTFLTVGRRHRVEPSQDHIVISPAECPLIAEAVL